MKLRLSLALTFFVAATALARAEPTVKGFWESRDADGNPTAWFLFTSKDEVYSARLVKGFKPKKDDGKPAPKETCDECPGKKKGARVMGLTLFWGMKRDGLRYEDGSVLDPRDGSVYHAKMWFDPDGDGAVVHVRGYLGISLLGQTQDWYRLPDDAMKKEDIPKEVLAGDEDKQKAHETVADKPKAHKKAKGKSDKSDNAEPADGQAANPAEKAQ